MWKKLFKKHYTYKDLCSYLENKHQMDEAETSHISDHINECKVCWSTWNRVRWDAAWVKQGTQELKEFLGAKFEKYFDSSWALAQDWYEQNPSTRESVENFYLHTPHYMYNSVIFYNSGDRYDLLPKLKDILFHNDINIVLDYGCGVGNDTLQMLEMGLEVYFADFKSPSMDFLKWRLEKRGYANYFESHYIDVQNPTRIPKVDMIWAIDVLEHMVNPHEIFRFVTDPTKVFFSYIDSATDASGRHPFHFPIQCDEISDQLSKHDFSLDMKDGHYCIWKKNNV